MAETESCSASHAEKVEEEESRLTYAVVNLLVDRLTTRDRHDGEVTVAFPADRAAVGAGRPHGARPLPRVVEGELAQLLERVKCLEKVDLVVLLRLSE